MLMSVHHHLVKTEGFVKIQGGPSNASASLDGSLKRVSKVRINKLHLYFKTIVFESTLKTIYLPKIVSNFITQF